MIRYIPVKSCDPCEQEYGKQVKADTYRILMDEPGRREFLEGELCEENGHNQKSKRYDLLSEYGRPVQGYNLKLSEGSGHGGALLSSDVEEVWKALSNASRPRGEISASSEGDASVPPQRNETEPGKQEEKPEYDTPETFDFGSIPEMGDKEKSQLRVMCLSCQPTKELQHNTRPMHLKNAHPEMRPGEVKFAYTNTPPKYIYRCECGVQIPYPTRGSISSHGKWCELKVSAEVSA